MAQHDHSYKQLFSYLLLDEVHYENDQLPAHNLVSAIFNLEKSQQPEDVRSLVKTLIEWLKDSDQSSLRRAFTVWLNRVLLPVHLPEQEISEVRDLMEVEAMLAERVKEWTVEWKESGLQEGMQKGMQKGEVAMLLRQLRLKFGTLDQEIINRVESADTALLLEWSERILTASRLEDVLKC